MIMSSRTRASDAVSSCPSAISSSPRRFDRITASISPSGRAAAEITMDS